MQLSILILIPLLTTVLSLTARASISCQDLFAAKKTLPELAQDVRNLFLKNNSYAMVPFSNRFEADIVETIFNYLKENHDDVMKNERHITKNPTAPDGWITALEALNPSIATKVINIAEVADQLARLAFPEYLANRKLKNRDLRWSHGAKKGYAIERWHRDNGQLDIVIILKGQGTEIYVSPDGFNSPPLPDASPTGEVPVGSILLFAGKDSGGAKFRFVPLFHRTPKITEDRLILVLRYLPL